MFNLLESISLHMHAAPNRYTVRFPESNRLVLQSALLLVFTVFFITGSFAAKQAQTPTQTAAQTSKKSTVAKKLNPTYRYLHKGKPVPPWKFVVGSRSGWYIELPGVEGQTKDNKLKVKPTDRRGKNDAISVRWNGKSMSQFHLSAGSIDLKSIENIGALVVALRVDKKPNEKVFLRMDCQYPCRGEVDITEIINALPPKKWDIVAMPLNCFSKTGTDLSKINSPLHIATEGKFALSISDARIQKMPPGAKGCAED